MIPASVYTTRASKSKISPPNVEYDVSDASTIPNELSALSAVRRKDKRPGRTGKASLYGAYKYVRRIPKYAAFGDYTILSACVQWGRLHGVDCSVREIKKVLYRYSEEFSLYKRNSREMRYVIENLTQQEEFGGIHTPSKGVTRRNGQRDTFIPSHKSHALFRSS